METLIKDPQRVAAIVGAGIGTLLGVPFLTEFLDSHIWNLVSDQYGDFADFVFFLIKGGVYLLAFSLLQASLYLALTSAVAATAMRFAF